MSIILRKEIARFLIIAFIFFLIPSDSFPVKRDERAGIKLINEAENLFRNYKYDESIEKFNKAKKYIKQENNLSRLYLGLSRSYYAMGLMAQVREAINKLAYLSVKGKIIDEEYPRGYLKIYNEILAEAARSGKETKKIITKEPPAGVIEKPGRKKKKKKSLILPIILGAAALGAAAFLMGKKTDGESSTANTGSVHIESTPSGAQVFVDDVNKGVTTPCDFTVSEGTHQLRLVIEGWGETERSSTIAKDQSISFNVQLAPYKYSSVLTFPIDDSISHDAWDADWIGNIYAVDRESSKHFLLKYNSEGVEESKIEVPISNLELFQLHVNNFTEQLYIFSSKTLHVFDLNGNLINTYSMNRAELCSIFSSGDIIFNINDSSVVRYDSNFNKIGDIFAGGFSSVSGIKCSDDNEHIYVGFRNDNSLVKMNGSGNEILRWQSQPGYISTFTYFTSFGEGELEKIFSRTSAGGGYFRIEIYNGNGDFLTDTENFGSMTRISEDNSYNFYTKIGANIIHKFEPSSETEGTGTWEGASLSTSSRIGSHGTTRIDPSQQKRSNKSDIKKGKKQKRIIK